MSAFSPIVNTPSELISPSTFPSISSSFWNLIDPLISTSLESTSLPVCSAIGFLSVVGDVVGDCVDDTGAGLCSSRGRWVAPLPGSSRPALNDPSPIEDKGFCGMNFFSTLQYVHRRARCQL